MEPDDVPATADDNPQKEKSVKTMVKIVFGRDSLLEINRNFPEKK